MLRRKKLVKKPVKPLDMTSGKRGRGRPRKVRPSEILGRAQNYHFIFGQIWDKLRDPLLQTTTEEEIIRVFEEYARPYTQEFVPALKALIFKVIRDPKFPKRPQAQIKFIADSLAAYGWVSARRSRDICERERNKKVNYILRQDYYIECTCKYKGPALHGKCPKCGTGEVSLPYIVLDSEGAGFLPPRRVT